MNFIAIDLIELLKGRNIDYRNKEMASDRSKYKEQK